MKISRQDDGSFLYFDSGSLMQVHDFGNGASLHVRRGVMTEHFAPYVIEDGERQIHKAGRFVLMVDAVDVKMHTTEFRDLTTEWFRSHDSASVHMLIRSRMLEMAINVANLVMGVQRAKAYYEPEVWAAACKQEAPSFERRPLVVPKEPG